MTETELSIENTTEDIKLYSIKSISLSTFIGGPIGGAYLIGENLKALGRYKEGRDSLIYGIIITLILLGLLLIIPEEILEKFPNQLFPAIYTVIIWLIAEKNMGDILKSHKENNNSFYSGWRAAGIGAISLVVMGVGMFGYVLLTSDNENIEQFDSEMAVFMENETEALLFYNHLGTESVDDLLNELENKTIPVWRENIEIIKRISTIEDLPSEMLERNELLLEYSELRLKAFLMFKLELDQNVINYSNELEQVHIEIEEHLKLLNVDQ